MRHVRWSVSSNKQTEEQMSTMSSCPLRLWTRHITYIICMNSNPHCNTVWWVLSLFWRKPKLRSEFTHCQHICIYIISFHLICELGNHKKQLVAFWYSLVIWPLWTHSTFSQRSFLSKSPQTICSIVVPEIILGLQLSGLFICRCQHCLPSCFEIGTFAHVSCHQAPFSFVWFWSLSVAVLRKFYSQLNMHERNYMLSKGNLELHQKVERMLKQISHGVTLQLNPC